MIVKINSKCLNYCLFYVCFVLLFFNVLLNMSPYKTILFSSDWAEIIYLRTLSVSMTMGMLLAL